jgi:hypothetical protein
MKTRDREGHSTTGVLAMHTPSQGAHTRSTAARPAAAIILPRALPG